MRLSSSIMRDPDRPTTLGLSLSGSNTCDSFSKLPLEMEAGVCNTYLEKYHMRYLR